MSTKAAGFCHVRRTAEGGLEIATMPPKRRWPSTKQSTLVWSPFESAGAAVDRATTPKNAKRAHDVLNNFNRGIAIGQLIGRLFNIRSLQSALSFPDSAAGRTPSTLFAEMLGRANLAQGFDVASTPPIASLFDESLAYYMYAASAAGTFFGDSSLISKISTMASVIGAASTTPARRQAIACGLLSAAVAADAIKAHLPYGQDFGVKTNFACAATTKDEETCVSDVDNGRLRRLKHKTEDVEFYVEVHNMVSGALFLQFPIAYENIDTTTDIDRETYEDRSVLTTTDWSDLNRDLSETTFTRQECGRF